MNVIAWPSFFPREADQVTTPSAIEFARRYRRSPIAIPSLDRSIETAHVSPIKSIRDRPPVCFLHGFDSSGFDFRDLMPYAEKGCEAWAVDLVGWGFSDHSLYLDSPSLPCSPEVKREHLYQFWKDKIKRPMCLMGVSLGGAVAVDFALNHPEAVDALVLSSSQGYIDGLGLLSKVPSFVAKLGVQILQTKALRRSANDLAYFDKSIDIEQAMVIGRLHTFLPGWMEASLAFIRSDGYSLSEKISNIDVPTLILWGREDRVLKTSDADRFRADIKNSKRIWIEQCGHAGHIEKYKEIGDCLLDFLEQRKFN